MRATVIEIAWHESTPIWSIHLSKHNRLVTAGGDKVARIWHLSSNSQIQWQCDLRAHTTTVNTARFSPTGTFVATGADGGEIVIWLYDAHQQPSPSPFETISAPDAPQPQERWLRHATLRAHVQDVLDLSWSSDSSKLVSASIDNFVHVWNIATPTRPVATLTQHSNFVQGVAIDPFSRLIASLGNDRSLCVYSHTAKPSRWDPVASVSTVSDAKLFVDDANFKTFFRRLDWSPDGSVLACPSGIQVPQTKRFFAVHLFARAHWTRPIAQCAALPKPACAVRFSPVLYALRDKTPSVHSSSPHPGDTIPSRNVQQRHGSAPPAPNGTAPQCKPSPDSLPSKQPSQTNNPFSAFSYRMVFAVACVDAIFFYDTQSFTRPFAKVEGLHCAEHTDIAWSADGLSLVVSSVDGYASVISFTKEELGCPLPVDRIPPWLSGQRLLEPSISEQSLVESKKIVDVCQKPSALAAKEIACMLSAEETNHVYVDRQPKSEKCNAANDVTPRKFSRLALKGDKSCPKPMQQTTPTVDLPHPSLQLNASHGYRIMAQQPSKPPSAAPAVTIVQPKRRINPAPMTQTIFNVQKNEKPSAPTPVKIVSSNTSEEVAKSIKPQGVTPCVASESALQIANKVPLRPVATLDSAENVATGSSAPKRKACFEDSNQVKQSRTQSTHPFVDLS